MAHVRSLTSIVTIVCALSCAAAGVARAQSAVDGFDPGANAQIRTAVFLPSGAIWVAGDFTMMGGGGTGSDFHKYIAQMDLNGTLNAFDFGTDAPFHVMLRQPDGKVLVGGDFQELGGGGNGTSTRRFLGRFNSNGSLDQTFDPGADGPVYAFALQPDGKILVGGSFLHLGGGGTGTTVRADIGRLNADGTLDSTFNPGANGTVRSIAVQADGQILVAGDFGGLGSGTGATPRHYIGRLYPDGTVDPSFDPDATNTVRQILVQPDRKIVVVGTFPGLNGGGTSRQHIARLNPNGSVDSFNPGANGNVLSVALQPDGKIVVGGAFTKLGGGTGTITRNYVGRIAPDGTVDAAFDPGADDVVSMVLLQQFPSNPGGTDGRILLGGAFAGLGGGTGTTSRHYIGRLNADGTVDASFHPGADDTVYALAVQPNRQVLVGGAFTHLGGGSGGTTPRSYIGRLNSDGSLDDDFDPGADSFVYALAVQRDGKILVGGNFDHLGNGGVTTRHHIGRLNADGTLDSTFNPGADNNVVSIVVQPDDKILVGGFFTTLGGSTRNHIGRLNANGSLDMSFDPGADGNVLSMALQPNGDIVVGGSFTGLGGGTGTTTRNRLGRLHTTGAVDDAFDPGANATVNAVALQLDGKILVGGAFTGLGNTTGTTTRFRIGRVNGDGTVDSTFNPGASGTVYTLAVHTDFEYVTVGGSFTGLGGGTGTTARNRIGRIDLFNIGVVEGYNPGADDTVYALAIGGDGRIVAGGAFTMLGGGGTGTTTRSHIGRVTSFVPNKEQLTVAGRRISWARHGDTPELSRATFELSTDGVSYSPLGAATIDPASDALAWELDNQSLPVEQNLFIRARGWYSTAQYNGSSSIDEFIANVYLTSAPFTDDPLTARVSVIRAVHITELRTRIDAVRSNLGLGAYPYTDAIVAGTTIVKAQHILDLRTALAQAYAAAHLAAPTYSTSPGVGVIVRAADIAEIRAALVVIE